MTNDHMVEFIDGPPVYHRHVIQDRGVATPCMACGKPIEASWRRYVVPRTGHIHIYCHLIGSDSSEAD